MVQFLSIIFFFLDFFNFCWVFQKFPFFFVSSCIKINRPKVVRLKVTVMFDNTLITVENAICSVQ